MRCDNLSLTTTWFTGTAAFTRWNGTILLLSSWAPPSYRSRMVSSHQLFLYDNLRVESENIDLKFDRDWVLIHKQDEMNRHVKHLINEGT